jgi:hypothetical protein
MSEFSDHEIAGRRLVSEALARAGLRPGIAGQPDPEPDEDSEAAWGPHGEGCLCDPEVGLAADFDINNRASYARAIERALAAGIPVGVVMPFATRSGHLFSALVPMVRRPDLN